MLYQKWNQAVKYDVKTVVCAVKAVKSYWVDLVWQHVPSVHGCQLISTLDYSQYSELYSVNCEFYTIKKALNLGCNLRKETMEYRGEWGGMGTLRRGGSDAPLIDIERMQQQLPPRPRYQRQWFGVWWEPVEPNMAVGAMGPPWCLQWRHPFEASKCHQTSPPSGLIFSNQSVPLSNESICVIVWSRIS